MILATDDDREGEAIAWHLCQLLNLDLEKTPRIIFHEITKPAVLEAMKTPTYVNMNVVMAQQCRQVIDLLVGFKVSPVLWKRLCYSKDGALSAGRCQTPALRLVYDNDKLLKENESKETKQKMKVKGLFTRKNIEFELNAELEERTSNSIFTSFLKTRTYVFSWRTIFIKKETTFTTNNIACSTIV